MSEVILFGDHARLPRLKSEDAGLLNETFLLEEGLDLLASYRSIGDDELRRSLKGLIANIAKTQRRATTTR